MKKIILLIITATLFAGCQKELTDYTNNPGGNGNGGGTDSTAVNPLKGNWNFDTLHLESQTSSDVSIDGFYNLTVSDLNYSSFGNNGSLTVNDSLFILTNYTYSISTTLHAKIYQDNVFVNNADLPFNYYMPPANSTSKYELIGTDSVYFPEGGFASADTTAVSKPFGLKFKIDGSSLTFIQPVNIDTTFNNGGLVYHDTALGIGYLYFHKK